ncbi:SubName: Full=Uncharacterized protein {ECO:0000313/EMBL:CCA76611.1} [Serendipita indica DSM 11827]|nr:SubName: Full=Uncharacterized protein {ECO:0000313/EMBL:CCA76611.1} [Serendipita indica DSM 11827]
MLLHIPTTTTSSRSQAANGSNTTVNAPRRANVAFNEIDGERRRVAEYTGAFNIVVESGAIYSIILAMELMLYSLGQNFIFVLYTSMAQITGIAPTGIIVLVLLGRTLRHSNRSVSAPSSHRHQQSITNISFAPTGSGHARGARNFKFFGSRRPGSSGRGRDGADNDVISLDLDITHRNRRAVDEENSPGSAAINGSYSPDVKRSSGYDETCESSTPFGSAIAVAVSDGDRDRKPSFSKTRGGAAPTKIEIDVRTEQQVLESRVGGRGGYTYPETPNLDVDSTQRTWETHSPPRSPPQSRNPYAQPPSSQPLVNAQTHAPQSPTRVHTPQYHRPNLQARRTTSAQESPSFETNQGATRGEEESGGYGGTVVDRNPYLSPHGGDWRPVDGNTDWRPVGNGQDDWRHAGA